MVSYSLIVAKMVRKVLGSVYDILKGNSFRDTCKFTPAETPLFVFWKRVHCFSHGKSFFNALHSVKCVSNASFQGKATLNKSLLFFWTAYTAAMIESVCTELGQKKNDFAGKM